MSATVEQSTAVERPAAGEARVFMAVLRRDLYVTWRELPVFLAQVVLQPLFLLLVFGRVLSDLGFTRPGYTAVLFPGIVAMTAVLTALQSTAFPLVLDFSYTKEIEDRLLAPMPVWMVGLEKIVFSALRAVAAAVVMFPVGILVVGSIPWRASGVPLLIAILVLGSVVGAALGLILGTAVPVNRINVIFAVILTPLLFTGASQYPWASLDRLCWFQVVTALNPLTYVSEGMRAALEPTVPHIRPLDLGPDPGCMPGALDRGRQPPLPPPRHRLASSEHDDTAARAEPRSAALPGVHDTQAQRQFAAARGCGADHQVSDVAAVAGQAADAVHLVRAPGGPGRHRPGGLVGARASAAVPRQRRERGAAAVR
jgi:ABC-2 type transport system permease protein